MYISKIKLTNIRGFKAEEISFYGENNKPQMSNLFIGMNGTCKTTILRCIAIGLSGGAA
ncbi:MAG: AAA family ATPase, partial [SAR324 cluster bacterium]|nr:AAA family ATPase [SAR324 cluster bacterium]